MDEDYNWAQYFRELENRKKVLESLLSEKIENYQQLNKKIISEKEILKTIWKKEDV